MIPATSESSMIRLLPPVAFISTMIIPCHANTNTPKPYAAWHDFLSMLRPSERRQTAVVVMIKNGRRATFPSVATRAPAGPSWGML